MKENQLGCSAMPEDHPEQHPWEVIADWGADDVQWCPHCGAILYRGEMRLPDLAKETR